MAKQNIWQKTFDTNGFEMTLHDRQHLVRIRTWGDWDAELAKKYQGALAEILTERHENDQQWGILVDITDVHPRSEEGQWMFDEQAAIADTRSIKKIAYLGTKSAVQLQHKALFQPTGRPQYACFESQDEALSWLLTD